MTARDGGIAASDGTKFVVGVAVDDSRSVPVLWLGTADFCVVPGLGCRLLSLAARAGKHLFRNPDLLDEIVHIFGLLRRLETSSGTAVKA
jgi:hypothetical protein